MSKMMAAIAIGFLMGTKCKSLCKMACCKKFKRDMLRLLGL